MRCTVVLEFDDGDSTALRRVELTRLYRDVADPKPGDIGLSLAEGKTLLQTVQQEFAMAQIQQFCELRRTCRACGAPRRRHDSHCSELKTTLGKVFYCRERWKACDCGADESRYVSPLKNYLPESSTGELERGISLPLRRLFRRPVDGFWIRLTSAECCSMSIKRLHRSHMAASRRPARSSNCGTYLCAFEAGYGRVKPNVGKSLVKSSASCSLCESKVTQLR